MRKKKTILYEDVSIFSHLGDDKKDEVINLHSHWKEDCKNDGVNIFLHWKDEESEEDENKD